MTAGDRAVAAAAEMMRLGVSRLGIVDLLAHYPIETIERQLKYLPLRKAKRPEALLIDAIKNDYSAPNPHRHAKDQIGPGRASRRVDEGPERPDRPTPAGA